MATHSSILAWEIPWTEEPGGLQSMGPQRVGQTEGLTFSLSLSSKGETSQEGFKGGWLEKRDVKLDLKKKHYLAQSINKIVKNPAYIQV